MARLHHRALNSAPARRRRKVPDRPPGSWSAPPSLPASCSRSGSTGGAMHTQGTDGRQAHGLGAAVKEVAERASSIVRLELELAAIELKRKIFSLGLGIAFAFVAAIMLLFVIGFAFATIAAALTTAVSTWLALLI